MSQRDTFDSAVRYRVRMLLSTAATLLLLIAVVRVWPAPGDTQEELVSYRVGEQEVIDIEQIQPTQQARQAPPPPAPPIPVVVPDDVLLPDEQLDLDRTSPLELDLPGSDNHVADGQVEGTTVSEGEMLGPKAVRFVEPEYTQEARRRRVRAEVVVEVLVDAGGRVQETRIEERFLLDRDGVGRIPVAEIGYGLEEAAEAAARRWIFRPARSGGRPVSSYTTLTFTFGV